MLRCLPHTLPAAASPLTDAKGLLPTFPAGFVPKISYLSLLDCYVLVCFAFMARAPSPIRSLIIP